MYKISLKKIKSGLFAGLLYTAVKYVILVLAFIKTGLIAYHLGPILLGSYAIVILVIEYLNYSNLGVFFSMTKEVSLYLKNNNNEEKIYTVQGSALIFSFISVFILILIYILITYLGLLSVPLEVLKYSSLIFALVLMYQLKQFILRYLRLFEKYFLLGFIEFLAQALNLIGILLFIQEFKIEAVLLSILIPNILLIIIGFTQVKIKKLNINFDVVRDLVISGSPILFYNIFLLMLTSIDRLMIGFYYSDTAALGYYQLSLSLSLGLFTVFSSIAFLFQPKWIRFYSSDDQLEIERNKTDSLVKHTYFLESALVFLAFLGICFTPYFIEIFLPEYRTSIIISQYLLLSLVAFHITFFSVTYLIANHYQYQILPALIKAFLLTILLNYILVELGYGLYGIAFSKIIAFLVYGLLIYDFLFRQINASKLNNIKKIYSRILVFLIPTCILIYEQSSKGWILLILIIVYAKSLIKTYEFLKESLMTSKDDFDLG